MRQGGAENATKPMSSPREKGRRGRGAAAAAASRGETGALPLPTTPTTIRTTPIPPKTSMRGPRARVVTLGERSVARRGSDAARARGLAYRRRVTTARAAGGAVRRLGWRRWRLGPLRLDEVVDVVDELEPVLAVRRLVGAGARGSHGGGGAARLAAEGYDGAGAAGPRRRGRGASHICRPRRSCPRRLTLGALAVSTRGRVTGVRPRARRGHRRRGGRSGWGRGGSSSSGWSRGGT